MRAPADWRRELDRRIGADVDRSSRNALRRLDRLKAPASISVEPLVLVGQLVERPFRALARDARTVRGDRDRLERCDVAGAEAVIELLLHADHHAFGADGQSEGPLDRASARLGDVDDKLGLEWTGRRAFGKIDRESGVAFGVGLHLVGELDLDSVEIVVGEASDVAGKASERIASNRLKADRAGHVETARRRAIEEPRVERELNRLSWINVWLGGAEREIETLGNIVLEQELDLADVVALRVGVGFNGPLSRSRTGKQWNGEGPPAEPLVGQGRALVLDAVRPLDDERQRQSGLGDALRVAQERGREHGLARPVDAALGVEESVEALRRVAPVDAAIGQVECGLGEAQEIVVGSKRRDQKARRRAALSAREARIEIDPPVGACRLRRQHLVVARHELQFDARQRPGGPERLHQRVDAVVAGDRRQAEIGDDHPLRRELHGFGLVRALDFLLPWARRDQVDAGL